MIDYIMVIWKNYDLLELQVKNFKKRFNKNHYNLIVIDNTPDLEKKVLPITEDYKYVHCNADTNLTKDGPHWGALSHGTAIDYGLTFCTTEIVSVIDSDFFILNNNIHHYIIDKFEKGYKAVGAELNYSRLSTKCPGRFKKIPCCFCCYCDINLAKSKSWKVTREDRKLAFSNKEVFAAGGGGLVGWKIRKYILENQIKTLAWKSKQDYKDNDCYFENEIGDLMGLHCVGGSRNVQSKQSLKSKIMIKLLP